MSFSSDSTDYASTRQRLDAARAEDNSKRIEEILDYILQILEQTREATAKKVNRYRKDVKHNTNDKVFLSTKKLATVRPCKKLDHKRVGPFDVTDQVRALYRLRLPDIMKVYDVFHPSLLSPVATNPLPGQKNPPPELVIVKGDEEWVVEDILDSKRVRNRLKYRVKQKGINEDLNQYNTNRGEFKNA